MEVFTYGDLKRNWILTVEDGRHVLLSTAELSRFDVDKLRRTAIGDGSAFGFFNEDETHTLVGWVKDAKHKIRVKKSVARIRGWARNIIDEIDANTDRPAHVVQAPIDPDVPGTSTRTLPAGLKTPISKTGAKCNKKGKATTKPQLDSPKKADCEESAGDRECDCE